MRRWPVHRQHQSNGQIIVPRFVVLHHTPGSQSARHDAGAHFDWMFEIDGSLRTWATEPITDLDQATEVAAIKLANHRLSYLRFEGEISGDRGTVRRVLAGTFTAEDVSHDRICATIRWSDSNGQPQSRRLEFYRNLTGIRFSDEAEMREPWCLRLEL